MEIPRLPTEIVEMIGYYVCSRTARIIGCSNTFCEKKRKMERMNIICQLLHHASCILDGVPLLVEGNNNEEDDNAKFENKVFYVHKEDLYDYVEGKETEIC